MEYKVSVLIAAYNAEKYLKECLDSLLSQSLPEVQIICIDDASTDSTPAILREYAAVHERIVVLTQSVNRGQAEARNLGLTVAAGEFITFLDSDDWLSADALEKAYTVTVQHPRTDTVLLDVCYFYEDTGESAPYAYRAAKKMYTGQEALVLSLDWRIHGIYLIRGSIHKTYPYDTTSRMYSDDNTTHIHFLHSREVRFSDGIYYYRQHPVSNTTRCNIHRFDFMDAGLSLKHSLIAEGLDPEIVSMQENFRWINIVGMYVYYLRNKQYFLPQERARILERFRFHLRQMDTKLLRIGLKYKFGYIPFKGCFPLFRGQVWLYHRIRRLAGR